MHLFRGWACDWFRSVTESESSSGSVSLLDQQLSWPVGGTVYRILPKNGDSYTEKASWLDNPVRVLDTWKRTNQFWILLMSIELVLSRHSSLWFVRNELLDFLGFQKCPWTRYLRLRVFVCLLNQLTRNPEPRKSRKEILGAIELDYFLPNGTFLVFSSSRIADRHLFVFKDSQMTQLRKGSD